MSPEKYFVTYKYSSTSCSKADKTLTITSTRGQGAKDHLATKQLQVNQGYYASHL